MSKKKKPITGVCKVKYRYTEAEPDSCKDPCDDLCAFRVCDGCPADCGYGNGYFEIIDIGEGVEEDD